MTPGTRVWAMEPHTTTVHHGTVIGGGQIQWDNGVISNADDDRMVIQMGDTAREYDAAGFPVNCVVCGDPVYVSHRHAEGFRAAVCGKKECWEIGNRKEMEKCR